MHNKVFVQRINSIMYSLPKCMRYKQYNCFNDRKGENRLVILIAPISTHFLHDVEIVLTTRRYKLANIPWNHVSALIPYSFATFCLHERNSVENP